MSRPRLRDLPEAEGSVSRFTEEGRGVVHVDGQEVAVRGALPGERVRFRYTRRSRRRAEGQVTEVLDPAKDRVEPGCQHFSFCGGCSLQHLHPERQIRVKEAMLLDYLRDIGGVRPDRVLPSLTGSPWAYRRRARLGVKFVNAKDRVLVGFREAAKPYVADLDACPVLMPPVGELLGPLATLIGALDARESIPQVEVSVGDGCVALVLRHLQPLSDRDRRLLGRFGEQRDLNLYLQAGGPDSVSCLYAAVPELRYELEAGALELGFAPTHFLQVNAQVNELLIGRVMTLLEPQPGERILDLYAGLGNFTLPMARRGAEVFAVEGEPALVEQLNRNVEANGLTGVQAAVADLGAPSSDWSWWLPAPAKVLLDPPRCGAEALIDALGRLRPRRVVYVSCNPKTLARDVGALCRRWHYRLTDAGVVDMFPHTSHMESIAVLEPGPGSSPSPNQQAPSAVRRA